MLLLDRGSAADAGLASRWAITAGGLAIKKAGGVLKPLATMAAQITSPTSTGIHSAQVIIR